MKPTWHRHLLEYDRGSFKEAQTIQNTSLGAAKWPAKGYFAKFVFFEAAILYICGHISKNAYSASRANHGGMESKGGWTVVRRCSPGGGMGPGGQDSVSMYSIYSIYSFYCV